MRAIELKPETIESLSMFFVDSDRLLKFGITRRLLVHVYKQLGFFADKEELGRFYTEGGYGKTVRTFRELRGVMMNIC
jgi:hypothetical protein